LNGRLLRWLRRVKLRVKSRFLGGSVSQEREAVQKAAQKAVMVEFLKASETLRFSDEWRHTVCLVVCLVA
jgi:hypothetical protein